MIGFQAPLWLLLLGLIPLVRWLHRFRVQTRIYPSTTLFLWAGLQGQASRDGDPGKPNPRWILRALVCCLLILALAEPHLQRTQNPPLDVWVDDSLSMFTREAGQTRLQNGLRLLRSHLDEREYSQIRLHSLGQTPGVLSLDPLDRSQWANRLQDWFGQPRAEPSPPPAAALTTRHSHILVTDGADEALNRWAGSAPLARIIRVGKLRQNLSLGSLSLRAAPTDSGPTAGTLRIDNLGDSASSGRLSIEQGGIVIETLEFEIPAQSNRLTVFTMPAGSRGSLRAELLSDTDSLALDDSLVLDAAGLRSTLAYATQGNCDPRFMAVLHSHPALVKTNGPAGLLIDCGGSTQDSTLPTLRLHPAPVTGRTTQNAHWHKQLSAGYIPLAAGLAYGDTAPPLASTATPLLSADGRALIRQGPGSGKVIDCYLDAGDVEFYRQAQYPLLFLALISRLTGLDLDSPPLSVGRNPAASRIMPLPIAAGAASAPTVAPGEKLLTELLLWAVFVALLADAALGLAAASGRLNWPA